MRSRSLASSAALLVAATGLIALPQLASAVAATTLYVDQGSSACSDSGSGAQAAPYCTIQAAANAATAGDTVLIAGDGSGYSNYNENIKITNSGTATAPITFKAAQTSFSVYAGAATFDIQGSYVHVVGANLIGFSGAALVVSGSNDTVDGSLMIGTNSPAVQFAATAAGDVIERSRISNRDGGGGIQVMTGASGITVSTNSFLADSGMPLAATGASGLNITSNTFISSSCATTSVTLTGVSQASIQDNIFTGDCIRASTPDLIVDSASSGSTTVGYNVLSTADGNVAPYSWAGTTYTTAAAFQAATGQGTADIVVSSFDQWMNTISPSNPAIDSANSNAPGELATDINGNPRVDNPSVPNTGVGTYTYYDRGAAEYAEYTGVTFGAYVDSPQRVSVSLGLQGFAWGASVSYTISWGDGKTDTLGASGTDQLGILGLPDTHVYASRGTYTITATLADDTQTITKTITVSTAGSTYTAVAPTRVLDTRTGTGAARGKVIANGTVVVDVASGVTGAPPVSTITAVVLNVTVTNPTAVGFITAYPNGGTLPNTSNVNYTRGETRPNLVTVKVGSGKVALHNASTGSTDLLADVQGYYVDSTSGSGYVPLTPIRLLDTRTGTGAPPIAVAPGGTVALTVEGAGSIPASGVSAVAVNVTVAQPTTNGFITVYADGCTLPNASNVNYAAGETVPNLVIVKVGADGKIDFHNSSTGTVQIIADAAGYYTASGGDAFVPTNPTRLLDTRTGAGQELVFPLPAEPNTSVVWRLEDQLRDEVAVVINVTVTNPTATGFITAYPGDGNLPNASNLNFVAGQTVPNLVMVGDSAFFQVNLYNASNGTTDLIADLSGYFS